MQLILLLLFLTGSAPDNQGPDSDILIKEIQGLLDDETVLLRYDLGSKSVLVITGDICVTRSLSEDSGTVASMVDSLKRSIRRRIYQENLIGWAQRVFKTLLEPVHEDIAGKKRLGIISADKTITTLPFACLVCDVDEGKPIFLINTHALFYCPRLATFKQCVLKRRSPIKNIACFGNPKLPAGIDMSDLPGAEIEAKQIYEIGKEFINPQLRNLFSNNVDQLEGDEVTRLVKNASVLTGDYATETAFKKSMKAHAIIDFSGFTDTHKRNFDTLIYLAPDDVNEGTLTTDELRGVRDSGVNLFMLMACNSIAFADILLCLDIPSLIVTTGLISDMGTPELMLVLMKNISEKSDYAEALRQAQLAMIKHEFYNAPFYWANYIVYGDPGIPKTGIESIIDGIRNQSPEDGMRQVLRDNKNHWSVGLADALIEMSYNEETSSLSRSLIYAQLAVEVARSLHDPHVLADALKALGLCYYVKANPSQALSAWQEEGGLRAQLKDTKGLAAVLNNCGIVYKHMGNYQEAESCYTKSIDIKKSRNDSLGLAYSWSNLAVLNFQRGEYEKAIALLDASQKLMKTFEDDLALARLLFQRGEIYLALGNNDLALVALDSSCAAFTKMGLDLVRAYALVDMGTSYLYLGNIPGAFAKDSISFEIFRKHGDEIGEAAAVTGLGLACMSAKKYEEARICFAHAKTVYNGHGMQVQTSRLLTYESSAQVELGDFSLAFENYDKAEKVFLEKGMVADLADAYQGKAGLFEALDSINKACDYYKKAIELKERIRGRLSREELIKTYTAKEKDAYKSLINLLIKLKHDKEAFEYLERSQAEVLRETFEESGIIAYDPSLEKELERVNALELQLAKLKSGYERNEITKEELEDKSYELQGKYEQALMDLKAYHPEVYDLFEPTKKNYEYIQKGIADSTLYLQFVIAEDSYLAFLITNEKIETRLFPERAFIDSILETYRIGRELKDDVVVQECLCSLYAVLIKPIEGDIEKMRNIVVIPFSFLHYLPFHALVKKNNDGSHEYLIEDKRISYLPSASFIETRTEKKQSEYGLIAFGNADGSLPSAEDEVVQIKQIYPKALAFIDGEATKERFLQMSGNCGIIHFATHGCLDYDPRRSYIVLAPKIEGNLTCREIVGLSGLFRDKTSLVTLSACETAVERDPYKAGRELTTLADAFKRAGVMTLVASLWPVVDISTASLMKDFYTNLKGGSMDKLEALRQAQIKMLHTEKFSDPFFWAPFILIGDWR